jgi:hypothetical protein
MRSLVRFLLLLLCLVLLAGPGVAGAKTKKKKAHDPNKLQRTKVGKFLEQFELDNQKGEATAYALRVEHDIWTPQDLRSVTPKQLKDSGLNKTERKKLLSGIAKQLGRLPPKTPEAPLGTGDGSAGAGAGEEPATAAARDAEL